MRLLNYLFGRGQPQSGKLVCPTCKEVYLVGVDATIVSVYDAFQDLRRRGATILSSRNPDNDASPSLVGHIPDHSPEQKESTKKEAIEVANRIRKAITAGKKQTWCCHRCNDERPHKYPHGF